MLMAQTSEMGHGYAQKYVSFLEGKNGKNSFHWCQHLQEPRWKSAWAIAFWLRIVMPAALLVVWKSVFVSEVNGKKCTEEANKCFLLLIHHFDSLCGRMDQVCQADQGFNH